MPKGIYLTDMLRRFWEKVDKNGPTPTDKPELGKCWLWISTTTDFGYGRFHTGRTVVKAHRLVYELTHRQQIPTNKEIDHLCREPSCVNPDHLEVVTHQENMLRSPIIKKFNDYQQSKREQTHCQRGHAFDETNTYWYRGKRACIICRNAAVNRHRSKRSKHCGQGEQ